MVDPTERFSGRVESYVRYRPGYPPEILDLLRDECGLSGASVVADVGSGTGLLSRLFLENGNRVYGVEPNAEMRAAGEELFAGYAGFVSVAATAEDTTLDTGSVDFVTAGQAFHWFDAEKARAEFARILRPGGWVVLVWNAREKDRSPFMADYERLLEEYGTDLAAVRSDRAGAEDLAEFFGPGGFEARTFENGQCFDLEDLKGRLLSTSYAPGAGHPDHGLMLEELEGIFHRHQASGQVAFEYETRVYYGRLLATR